MARTSCFISGNIPSGVPFTLMCLAPCQIVNHDVRGARLCVGTLFRTMVGKHVHSGLKCLQGGASDVVADDLLLYCLTDPV